MTQEKRVPPTSAATAEQLQNIELIFAYVEMAEECENKEDERGAEFLLRGANDALMDLMNSDLPERRLPERARR